MLGIQMKVGSIVRIPVPANVQFSSANPNVLSAMIANRLLTLTASSSGSAVVTVMITVDFSFSLTVTVTAN